MHLLALYWQKLILRTNIGPKNAFLKNAIINKVQKNKVDRCQNFNFKANAIVLHQNLWIKKNNMIFTLNLFEESFFANMGPINAFFKNATVLSTKCKKNKVDRWQN